MADSAGPGAGVRFTSGRLGFLPDDGSQLNSLSSARRVARLPPFQQDRPGQRPEVFAVDRETKLMYLEDLEQRSQLGPEFLLPHDRRTIHHRLVGVPCEGEPTRALARDAAPHPRE